MTTPKKSRSRELAEEVLEKTEMMRTAENAYFNMTWMKEEIEQAINQAVAEFARELERKSLQFLPLIPDKKMFPIVEFWCNSLKNEIEKLAGEWK